MSFTGIFRKSSFLLLTIPILILGFFLGLKALGGILIIADPLKPAEAVVALSGDDGQRIAAAAQLLDRKQAKQLFLTFTDQTALNAMYQWAKEAGVPANRIFVTSEVVANTLDEARAVHDLANTKNVTSLIVVTDPFHTLRTRLIFRRELKGSGISVQVRPVSGHWYRSGTWWQSALGIRLTFEEYAKIFLVLSYKS